MNKRLSKVLSLILVLAMIIPSVGCSQIEDFLDFNHSSTKHHKKSHDDDDDDDDRHHRDDDDEDVEEDEEDAEESEEDPQEDSSQTSSGSLSSIGGGTTAPVNDLTYPDHVPTYDELHPYHAPGSIAGDEASELLSELETQYISDAFSSSYVYASIYFEDPSAYGITFEEVSWGDIFEESEDDLQYYDDMLDSLYEIDYESLDYQDRAFYDKFVYDLEISKYMSSYSAFAYYNPIFDPLLGPQSELFFVLDVLEFDTVEDIENYLLVLEDIDRYYDEICTFEEDRVAYGYASTDDVYADMAECFDNMYSEIDTCFLYESFETRLDNVAGLTDDQKASYIEQHDDIMHNVVFPEFEECSDRMEALIGSGGVQQGVCAYNGGDAYYAVRFMSYANSSKSVEETITQLEASFDAYWNVYMGSTANVMNWIDEYLNHEYTMGDMQDNLDYLYDAIAPDFPDLPDHEYFLRDVPESMQENFSPAAYLGYHLDNFDSNMIITNQANVDSDFGVTCAHEGYPGHMFQSVYTRSICEHPYLYLFDSIGYVEGWATYVENYSYKYYADDSEARFAVQMDGLLNVLLMARFDIGINYEGWTAEDCNNFCTEHMGQGIGDSVDFFYNIVTNQPGYGVKYGIGFLNTGYTITMIQQEFPDATDEQIHTAYLNALPLTFEMIYDRMYAELSEG